MLQTRAQPLSSSVTSLCLSCSVCKLEEIATCQLFRMPTADAGMESLHYCTKVPGACFLDLFASSPVIPTLALIFKSLQAQLLCSFSHLVIVISLFLPNNLSDNTANTHL